MKYAVLITIILSFLTAEARFGGSQSTPGSRARGSGTDGGGGTALLCWNDKTVAQRIRNSQPKRKHVFVLSDEEDETIRQADRVELYDLSLLTYYPEIKSLDTFEVTQPRFIDRFDGEDVYDHIDRLIKRYDDSFPLLAADLRKHMGYVKALKPVSAPHGLPPAKDVIVTRNIARNCILATMIAQNLKKKELEIDLRIYRRLHPFHQSVAILHEIVLNRHLAWNYYIETNTDQLIWRIATHEQNKQRARFSEWNRLYGKKFKKGEVNKLVELLVDFQTTKEKVLKRPSAAVALYAQRVYLARYRGKKWVQFSTNRGSFERYLFGTFAQGCDIDGDIKLDHKLIEKLLKVKSAYLLSWMRADKATRAAYLNQMNKRKPELMEELRKESFGESFISHFDRVSEEFRTRIAGIVPRGSRSRRFNGKVFNKSVHKQICRVQREYSERIIDIPLPRDNWW